MHGKTLVSSQANIIVLFSNIMLFIAGGLTVCNPKSLNRKVHQFDGFSFYNCLEKPNYYEEHTHEEIQITLPQANAKAWMKCRSSSAKQCTKLIEAGQSYLVSSNQPHALDWQQTAEMTLFYIHPNFFVNAIGEFIGNDLEIDKRFSLVDDTLIREVGIILRHLCSSNKDIERLYAESLANLLAVHLLKNYLNCKVGVSDNFNRLATKKLNIVFEYIEANLAQKITLSDLAAIVGVGKFYFCRLFKGSTNLTPYNYVLQQRVKRAKKLLKNSELPICDIAIECGFSNQSHLAKHFRNTVGTTPKMYRQSDKMLILSSL